MIKNELTVVQGFGCLNKVFDADNSTPILYGNLIEVDSTSGLAQIVADVTTATGATLFIAQNTVANTDSAAMANSFNIVDKVTCYPLQAAIEIEIPAGRVLGSDTLEDPTAIAVGAPIFAAAGGTYAIAGSGTNTQVGTFSGVSEDGLATMIVGS